MTGDPTRPPLAHSRRDPMDLVSEHELTRRWRKSPRTLHRWRQEGYGPPWITVGRSKFLRWSDVLAFEDQTRPGGADR